MQLVYNVYYIRYQDPFNLWQVRLPQKHSNLSKYYVQYCRYIGTRSTLLFGLSNKMTNSPKTSHRGKIFCCSDLIFPNRTILTHRTYRNQKTNTYISICITTTSELFCGHDHCSYLSIMLKMNFFFKNYSLLVFTYLRIRLD